MSKKVKSNVNIQKIKNFLEEKANTLPVVSVKGSHVKVGKYYCLERNGVWEVFDEYERVNTFMLRSSALSWCVAKMQEQNSDAQSIEHNDFKYSKYANDSMIFTAAENSIMTIQSTGIVKVEKSDSSGLNAHFVVNNSESASGLSMLGSGSSFSSGGWAPVTDAGHIRTSAGSANGLVLQASAGDMRFYVDGSPTERARITTGGNFGIGTTNPSDKLHGNGGDIIISLMVLLITIYA